MTSRQDVEALREDLVDCFKAQRMAQILDNDERNQLEAAFDDRLDRIFAEYNKLRNHIDTAPAHRFCPVRSG